MTGADDAVDGGGEGNGSGDGPPCRHLEYRTAAAGRQFETARAYCTVVEGFVEPMRADVCNRRYGLDPAEHCEIYRGAGSE